MWEPNALYVYSNHDGAGLYWRLWRWHAPYGEAAFITDSHGQMLKYKHACCNVWHDYTPKEEPNMTHGIKLSVAEKLDFALFCENATMAQLPNIIAKERDAKRWEYHGIAVAELMRRERLAKSNP